jgi:hypothetical protein
LWDSIALLHCGRAGSSRLLGRRSMWSAPATTPSLTCCRKMRFIKPCRNAFGVSGETDAVSSRCGTTVFRRRLERSRPRTMVIGRGVRVRPCRLVQVRRWRRAFYDVVFQLVTKDAVREVVLRTPETRHREQVVRGRRRWNKRRRATRRPQSPLPHTSAASARRDS